MLTKDFDLNAENEVNDFIKEKIKERDFVLKASEASNQLHHCHELIKIIS